MRAISKILAGGAAIAAVTIAAPAAAQYYPNPYGYGYGGGGNVVGQVLNQVLGGGYGGYGGYGGNSQAVINQCVGAVQQRIARDYSYGGNGYSPYGYGGGYGGGYAGGYGGGYAGGGYAGGGRVLGINRVERRSGGGLTVRGVATSGVNSGYGYGAQGAPDLTFKCKTDYRGFVTDVDLDRTNRAYGYGNTPYDYSQYGYRRY
jgi:hypothetical protein